MMKELNLFNLGELSRFFNVINNESLATVSGFLFILNSKLRIDNNVIWFALF